MIKKIINKYIKRPFLIAYSGGLDSTVLLHQLLIIKKTIPEIQIRAIHVNHNLNIYSKKWVEHCKKICQKYNIKLIIEEINIYGNIQNLEEKLRIQRYNIIYNHLINNEVLLTGHHMNDQVETLVLSLKRGSGPHGLSSMSYETLLGNKTILRPFLKKTKKELQLWANNHNINWIEDISNLNIHYDRNFIRHKILPILEKRWPFFLKNCFRTSNLCRQETSLINTLIKDKIQSFINSDESLNISEFKNIQKEICTSFLRYWISLKNIKKPSYEVIQSIYQQMVHSQLDSNPRIILNNNEIRRYKTSLYFIKKQKNIKNTILFWHNTDIELILPNQLGSITKNNIGYNLPAPKNNELINIRFQYEGKILILGRDKRRKIKKIWQEKNIPPWLRNQIPLLFYNNHFISALGVFIINIKNRNQKTWRLCWSSNLELIQSNIFSFY